MRVGQYEVSLVKENGDAYKERQIGDKTYVQGEEGQEYQVKVSVYQESDGSFPAKYLRFGLLVDGDDIGSKKRLDLSRKGCTYRNSQPASCTILGFPTQSHAQKSFTFALPSLTSNNANYKTDLGSVQLLVSEAHKTGQMHPIRTSEKFSSQDRNAPCIIEDKKFYEQASLVTSAGTEKAQNGAHFKKKNYKSGPMASVWVTVRDIPEATMILYYHCRSTLDFLEEQENQRKRAAELVVVHSNGSSSSSSVPLVDLTATGAMEVEDTSVIELDGEPTPPLLVDLSAGTTSEGSSVEVVNGPSAGLKRARIFTVEDTSEDSEEILPLKVVKSEHI